MGSLEPGGFGFRAVGSDSPGGGSWRRPPRRQRGLAGQSPWGRLPPGRPDSGAGLARAAREADQGRVDHQPVGPDPGAVAGLRRPLPGTRPARGGP